MGKYYECLTGVVRCITAPQENKYNFVVGNDYDIVDGEIKGVVCDFNAIDLDELNWFFEKEKIKFELIEKGD